MKREKEITGNADVPMIIYNGIKFEIGKMLFLVGT